MLAKCGRLTEQQASEMQRRANQSAVGQFCAALRVLSWTHEEAARALGVSRETVWRWANELCTIPSWAVVRAKEEAYGASSVQPRRTGT